ncbi:unnamed protein product [Withania somnifera]
MGKNQITTKETTESQGVCEKIFKVVNISPGFRSFRRISSHESPKFANSSAKATISKPVALTQNGSTIPFELNRQQIPSKEKYQNLSSASKMVLVEYNHISGDSATHKLKAEPVKAVNKSHQQNEDPYKAHEPHDVNKSPHAKNMFTIVHHHEINEGPRSDDNDRFSNYIDHVKKR